MDRSRVVMYTLVAIAGLIVGGHAVLASADPAPPVSTSATAVSETNKDWSISGTIQAMNGEFWTVQGFVVRVNADTHIVGDLPTIGSSVEAKGTVQADGTWLATEVRLGDSPTNPTLTPSPARTNTAIPSATSTPREEPDVATATATPTPTAVATASATATPTAAATAPARVDQTLSDDQDESNARQNEPPRARGHGPKNAGPKHGNKRGGGED